MSGPSGLGRFLKPANLPIDVTRRPERLGECCEFCGEPITDEHPHVVNLEARNLKCTCRPCYQLFTPDGARGGRYVAVPERYLVDPGSSISEGQWEDLQVPVAMAFFFRNSILGTVVAQYPSPAGATESLLNLDAWSDIVATNPLAAALEPDVEALFVHRSSSGLEAFLVPIDVCYELVGRLRMHWTGFDGGTEARADVEQFVERIRTRSRHLTSGPSPMSGRQAAHA